jgi:hypothetical protein
MSDVAAEILALEDRRCAALIAQDFATLDELFTDGVIYTHSSGSVDTKASYLESLRSGSLVYRSIKRSNTEVAVYDGAAIIATGVTLEITANGTDKTINGRATLTWVRQGGHWRFAAWQSTPVTAH